TFNNVTVIIIAVCVFATLHLTSDGNLLPFGCIVMQQISKMVPSDKWNKISSALAICIFLVMIDRNNIINNTTILTNFITFNITYNSSNIHCFIQKNLPFLFGLYIYT